MSVKFETHIRAEAAGTKAIDLLQNETELSRQKLKQCMSKGAAWLTRDNHTQRTRRADKTLNVGDEIHLYYDEDVLAQTPPEAKLISDEGEYSLWYKPYGLLSQGSKWGDHCTIGRWIETHIQPQRPAYLVHRLDRAASGLMVFAHGKKIASSLAKQFEQRAVDKRYLAIVEGHLEETLELTEPIDDRNTISRAKPLKYSESQDQSLIEVEIETGRKHQIRKHLSGAGFPIVGDRLYNQGCKESDPNLMLMSYYLALNCPITGERNIHNLPTELRLHL